jgi:hypothetical protein
MMLYELTTTTPSSPPTSTTSPPPTADDTTTDALLEEPEAITDLPSEEEAETEPPAEENTEERLVQSDNFLAKVQSLRSMIETQSGERQIMLSATDGQTRTLALEAQTVQSKVHEPSTMTPVEVLEAAAQTAMSSMEQAQTSESWMETQTTGPSLKVLTSHVSETVQTTSPHLEAQTATFVGSAATTEQSSSTFLEVVHTTEEGEAAESTVVAERKKTG